MNPRKEMTEMDSHARGASAEARFFEVVRAHHADMPQWLVGILPVGPEYDVRGVDAIAYVEFENVYYEKDPRVGRIPIQIKSSVRGMLSFLDRHEEFGADGVVVVIVNDDRDDDAILFSARLNLETAREKGKTFWDDYFRELFDTELTEKANDRMREMVRSRIGNQK
jgi:hypothetical protein